MPRKRIATFVTAATSIAFSSHAAKAEGVPDQKSALVSQAQDLLNEGCTGVSGFNIANYHLEILEEQRLIDLINELSFSVDSFCVSKELDFMEQGVAKEPDSGPAQQKPAQGPK